MKLYFYNCKRYPHECQPAYYNVTKGYAGFVDEQEGVCIFEGTVEEFLNRSTKQPRKMHRKTYRAYH